MKKMPHAMVEIIDKFGMVSTEWRRFFDPEEVSSGAPTAVTLSASPFTYTAKANGVMVVSGTVTALQYGRKGTLSNVPVGQIKLLSGDQIKVTYATAPTMTFYPD